MISTGVEHSASSLAGRLTRELTGRKLISRDSNGFKISGFAVVSLRPDRAGATWNSPVQHHTLPRRDRSRPYVVAEPDRVLSRGQGDRLVDLFKRKRAS